jgi:hypothetical protein
VDKDVSLALPRESYLGPLTLNLVYSNNNHAWNYHSHPPLPEPFTHCAGIQKDMII